MPRVVYTPHLRRFFPDLEEEVCAAATARELVATLDARHPGLGAYLLEDDGALRKHVNLFIDESPLVDRQALSDPLRDDSVVHVIQALSGG